MNISFDIKNEIISDLIIIAVECGCDYWLSKVKLFDKVGMQTLSVTNDPLVNLSRIVFVENKENDFKSHTLMISDPDRIARGSQITDGLSRMATQYPQQFADILQNDIDTETADIFIQCCILGKIIYG